MIQISYEVKDGRLIHLLANGHGGLEYGKDVICAGVSACLIGALNALEHSENFHIDVQPGKAEVQEIKEADRHDRIVLETLIVQLKTIADSYPQNVEMKASLGKKGKK